MAAKMTPSQFADKYLDMDAYMYPQDVIDPNKGKLGHAPPKPGYVPPTGWQRIRVDNYRLGASPWDATFWRQDIAPHFKTPVSVKVKNIWGTVEDHTFAASETARRHFHFPFVGKGSPEQAQIAIQLVYRFRRVTTPLEKFGTLNFVGLDCNGFVGNYVKRVVLEQDWFPGDNNVDPGPTTLTWGLLHLKGLTTPVTDLKDLKREGTYILGMCDAYGNITDPSKDNPTNYGHVMITEPESLAQAGRGPTVTVVEATAAKDRKLVKGTYTFTAEKKIAAATKSNPGLTVFTADRGALGGEMKVRIARLAV